MAYLENIYDDPIWRGSKINNYLFVGSSDDANNYNGLKDNGITHILNVADNVKNFFPNEFIYCNLHVKDFGNDSGISRVFNNAFEFINKAKKENGIIFVHCLMGINRSVTTSIAIIMKFEDMKLNEAWKLVKSNRKQASPFEDNIKELLKYEKELYGENSMENNEFGSCIIQ